jgi:hypothetical protein
MKRLLPILALAACVDRGPGDDPRHVDSSTVAANVLDAVPDIPHRVDIRFRGPHGGEVVYLGNDLAKQTFAPGDVVTVNHYWRVIAPPGPGWRIFGELQGKGTDFVVLDDTDMRRGLPSEKWQIGTVFRDPQTFVVPKTWTTKVALLRVGLIPEGAHRIADRMEPVHGDPDFAATVGQLPVDLTKAPPPPGTQTLKKAGGSIVIDGKADDPGWRNALSQTAFTTAEGCPALNDGTTGKMTWDDQYLYVFVSAEDADVFSPFTEHDAELWHNDVVEVFVDADGNRRGYVELQVNPNNAVFDTWYAVGRPNRDDSYESHMQTAVVVQGTTDDRDDGDSGWDVEIAIPWEAARGKDPNMHIDTPPKLGDVWHVNVVRGEGPQTGGYTAASWNPIGCEDFHALDKMLLVQFADKNGNVKPPAEAPPTSTPQSPSAQTPTGSEDDRLGRRPAAPLRKPGSEEPSPGAPAQKNTIVIPSK